MLEIKIFVYGAVCVCFSCLPAAECALFENVNCSLERPNVPCGHTELYLTYASV